MIHLYFWTRMQTSDSPCF